MMGKPEIPITKRSLGSWVWASSIKLQLLLLLVIAVTVFARVLPLEMQKRIVNQAIQMKKIDLLFLYCGLYLAAVVTASGLKFVINLLQAHLGQKALADMRKALYHHILTLPLSFFRKTSSGMVVSSVVTEIASAGDFVGQAIAVPVASALTLLAFAGYLIWLNPFLALISLAIYPFSFLMIPQLQKRTNKANKDRLDATREISSKVGEAITGVHEIHGNGSYHIENRRYDRFVDRLFKIRMSWTIYKNSVKISNNFFVGLSPFLIFIVGGYLTIKGRFDLGALVAFLSAQEKIYEPWKELIDFYQTYQDASVGYRRTMEYYDAEPEHAIEPPEPRKAFDLEGSVEVTDLSFKTDTGIQLLGGINLVLKPGEQLALVGFSGSGKSTLAQCIGQLYKYTGGHVHIGGKEVAELTKRDIANNVGYVAQAPFIFSGSIKENLIYACESLLEDGEPGQKEQLPSLDDMIQVLQHTGLFVDVLRFGMNTLLVQGEHDELAQRIIRVRENYQSEFGEALVDYVEFFDENRYLYYSSVASNLTFGSPDNEDFAVTNLPMNLYFLEFLNEAHLTRPLMSLGADLTRQVVDILGNMPPDDLFFEHSPIGPAEIDDYKLLLERLRRSRLHELTTVDQSKILELALRFIPGRHTMVALPELLEGLILEGRALFKDKITQDHPGAISFYTATDYLYSQTILENILFGKTKTTSSQAQEKINQSIMHLLIEEDLLETIIEIGMDFQVGSKGDRLSGGQRQKLAIARVFLKEPRILIMDEATSALDNRSQARIQNLLETKWKGKSTLIAVAHRLDTIKSFHKIAVMKAGKILEMGGYDELIAKKGMLYELVYGKRSAA